jgi:hypothetical protein
MSFPIIIVLSEVIVKARFLLFLIFNFNRLIGHENSYVTELSNSLKVRRRLKRQWPSDLKDQREEEV